MDHESVREQTWRMGSWGELGEGAEQRTGVGFSSGAEQGSERGGCSSATSLEPDSLRDYLHLQGPLPQAVLFLPKQKQHSPLLWQRVGGHYGFTVRTSPPSS